jgi:pimeloyl-ACP methyl ester carboxylesterase
LILCIGLYVLVCVAIAVFQRRLIYFPPVCSTEEAERMGRDEGLVRWTNPEGQPIGWKRLAPTQPAQGRVLVSHGNAGTAFQCGHYADVIQQAAALDVFIVEYPGYADRPGKPSERALDESADESLRLLGTNVPVYLVGESLGTGVAAYLAGRYPNKVAGVALLAPYNRLADVARSHYPILPVSLLLLDRFPAEDYLCHYTGPVAFLTAGGDSVVPEKFGRRLYDSYCGLKGLWRFAGGDHGTVMFLPPELWAQIIAFWRGNSKSSAQQH